MRSGLALLVVLLLAFVGVSADPRSGLAYADVVPIPPVYAGVPDALASAAAVAEAEGVVTAFGAASASTAGLTSGALGTAAVCAGVLPACAAGALVVGTALLIAWKWKPGHNPAAYDQPGSTGYQPGVVTQTQYTYWNTPPIVSGTNWSFNMRLSATSASSAVEDLPINGRIRMAGFDAAGTRVVAVTPTLSPQQYGVNSTYAPTENAHTMVTLVVVKGSIIPASYTEAQGYGILGEWRSGYVAPPSYPTGTQPVTVTPKSTCSNGSTTTTVTGSSIVYTGATADGDLPPIVAPACPAGYQRTGLTTPATAGGATVPSPMTWTAPSLAPYPNCQPGGSESPCVMRLTKTDPAGKVTNCTNTTACAGWNPAGEADGSTYTCKFGTYVLAASECKTVPTEQGLVAAPATQTETDTKNGVKSAGEGTGTSDDPSDPNCAFKWTWDPRDWAERPFKCALRWFWNTVVAPTVVPSEATMTRLKAEGSKVADTVPFSYMADVQGWLSTAFGGASGHCLTLQAVVPPFDNVKFLDTCNPSGRPEQLLIDNRTLLGVVMYVGLFSWIAWWAWKQYAPLSQGSA